MKYNVGDRVRIKSIDWYNENKDNRNEITFEHNPHWRFVANQSDYCGQIATITAVSKTAYRLEHIPWNWTDEMIEGLAEEETVHNKWTGLKVELELSKTVIGVSNVESVNGERFMSGFVKAIIPPEGYIFKDENGNVINAQKIVLEKKKKEYPKTYEGCCKVLGCKPIVGFAGLDDDEENLYEKFIALKRCRDAYWKIAGEEMGLGKPWVPQNTHDVFSIIRCDGILGKSNIYSGDSSVLEFPTEEMRDVFYDNFKELTNECKELL